MEPTVTCHPCGEPLSPGFAFCENCGAPTRPVVGDAPVAEKSDAPTAAAACACGGTDIDADGYCGGCGRKQPGFETLDAIDAQAIDAIAASASHRGRRHVDNQDAVGLRRLADGSVAIALADGVSSACRARQAADTAVRVALETLAEGVDAPAEEVLALAVRRAHDAVCHLPHDDPRLAEPQATLAVALVRGDVITFAWVGDTRVYLLQDGASRQLSLDDSWLNDALRQGVPRALALADANAHCITQCLGMRDDVLDVHVAREALPAGATLLACSDGLWNYLPDAAEMAAQALAPGDETLARRCARLVDFANRAGGVDNVTVAMYRSH